MTQEEKAKAYDEAIEKLRRLHDDYDTVSTLIDIKEELENIFPELKESEDERMVKFIKKQLFNIKKTITENYELDAKLTKAIDWLEKQGNLMKALQISNAKIGELIEKNYYLKEQLEKQCKNNMGISEATKKELEDNLNKALEKETPESCNEFLDEQGSKKETLKERNICDTCEDSNGCLIPCCAKLLEKQGEQKATIIIPKFRVGDEIKTSNEESLTITKIDEKGYWSEDLFICDFDEECIWDLVEHKPAWSEEDVAMLDSAIAFVEHSAFTTIGKGKGGVVAWLKSLKERYTWRPSDEQTEALDGICSYIRNQADWEISQDTIHQLYSLSEQLKKLKE